MSSTASRAASTWTSSSPAGDDWPTRFRQGRDRHGYSRLDGLVVGQRSMIEFMAITNDPAAGALWHEAGVQRIMVDLETYGKAERQKLRDTVKSDHALADLRSMRQALPAGHLVVRTEPVALPGWSEHVEQALIERPTSLMVPMIESRDDVERAREAVGDRAELIVMIETAAALRDVDELMAAAPHATFFVGLNDLHVQLGQRFMFEPLADGHVEAVSEAARSAGVKFGFGGLARQGEGLVDSAAVVREHVRLGSTLAILARSFFGGLTDPTDVDEIAMEIRKLRETERRARLRSEEECQADARELRTMVARVAAQLATAPPGAR